MVTQFVWALVSVLSFSGFHCMGGKRLPLTPASSLQDWGTQPKTLQDGWRHGRVFCCLSLAFSKLPFAKSSMDVTVYVSERWNSWGQVWEGDIIDGGRGRWKQGRGGRWRLRLKNWDSFTAEIIRGGAKPKTDGLHRGHLTPKEICINIYNRLPVRDWLLSWFSGLPIVNYVIFFVRVHSKSFFPCLFCSLQKDTSNFPSCSWFFGGVGGHILMNFTWLLLTFPSLCISRLSRCYLWLCDSFCRPPHDLNRWLQEQEEALWSSSNVPRGHSSATLTRRHVTRIHNLCRCFSLPTGGVLQAHMKKRLNEICTDVKVFASRPLSFYDIVWNCHCKNDGHLFSAVTAFIMVFQSF